MSASPSHDWLLCHNTRLQGVREMGWRGLPIPKDTEAWRQRVAWLRRAEGPASELPDMEEQVLMATAAKWLGPHLAVGGRLQAAGWA
jgi:hypothetical protein